MKITENETASEITSSARKWYQRDKSKRNMIVLMSEAVGDDLHMYRSISGNYDAAVAMLVSAMVKDHLFKDAVMNAARAISRTLKQ